MGELRRGARRLGLIALAMVVGWGAEAEAADPWGRPGHLRAVGARPVDWEDRAAPAPVRLWWDDTGVPAAVEMQHRGRWRRVAEAALPGWQSTPVPRGVVFRVRPQGASRWSEHVGIGPVDAPDRLAVLGGWDGGADVVGEVELDPRSGRVLASTVGGGLWSHQPGQPARRLGSWEGLPDARVLSVHAREDGTVVVGTARGAAVLDAELRAARVWDSSDGLPSDWVQAVRWEQPVPEEGDAGGSSARLWLGSYEGLAWVEDNALTVGLAPWSVFSLAAASGGGVWAGYEGLRRVRPGEEAETWLSDVHVYGILESKDGVELATSERGAVALRRPGVPQALDVSVRSATGLAADGGRRWVAAGAEGLVGTDGTRVGRRHGLPADGVRAVAVGPDGSLWVGTDSGLAAARVGGALGTRARSLATGFPTAVQVHALAGTEGGLWMATDRGLWAVGAPAADRSDSLIVASGEDAARAVVVTPDGAVSIGSRVVAMARKGRLRAWTPPAGVVAGTWSQDRLWVGGAEGLWTVEDDQLQRTSALRDVRALAADARGVWAISGVNLFRVVGAAAVPYLRTHPPLAVAGAPGGAWVGTTDGLERLVLGGEDPGGVVDVLGEADAGVSVPAVAADADGGVWFAAADGTVGHVAADGALRTAQLPGPDAPEPTAVWPDGADAAWVGTTAGLWRVTVGATPRVR